MLLPYRDNLTAKRRPFVNWALIIINVGLFLYYGYGSDTGGLDHAWDGWALIADQSDPLSILSGLFSHMFLHGGWEHLIGNMLFLYIFGDQLEDTLGHFWFLVFYLVCGVAGGLAFLMIETEPTRLGGASGAIAGVMGGYLLLFPRAKIIHVWLLPNILWPFSILLRLIMNWQIWGYWPILFLTFGLPTWLYSSFWVIWNFRGATLDSYASDIGYSTHLGGFFTGLVIILFVRMRLTRRQENGLGHRKPPSSTPRPHRQPFANGPWGERASRQRQHQEISPEAEARGAVRRSEFHNMPSVKRQR